jgi:hypothetical protein
LHASAPFTSHSHFPNKLTCNLSLKNNQPFCLPLSCCFFPVLSARRDLTASQKVVNAAQNEHKGKEIRLQRALEECEKYKNVLAKATEETREGGADSRKMSAKFEMKIKSLERQRAELLIAFKKQMKLIDVLKRQKVHVEAAKLLSFTEEEFVKILAWGED